MPSKNLRNNELEWTPTFGTLLIHQDDCKFIYSKLVVRMTNRMLSTGYSSGIQTAIPDDNLGYILITDIPNEIAKSANTLNLNSIKLWKRALKLKEKTIREA